MPARSPATTILIGTLLAFAGGSVATAPAFGGDSEGPPPKRQPGSWTSRIEVTNVTGKDADIIKKMMNDTMAEIAKSSICVTPEMAAKDDLADNATKFAGGDCTLADKDLTGSDVGFSATCKSASDTTRIVLKGTVTPTVQDFTISISGSDVNGPHSIDMTVHSQRNGECTAADLREPVDLKDRPHKNQ